MNSERVSQQSWSKYSLPSNPPQAQTYSQPKILIFKIENLTIWAEILIKEKKSTLNPVKWEAARAELQTLKEKLKQFSIISPQTMEEEDPVHDSRGQRGASWPRYNKKKKKTQASISQDPQCGILSKVLARWIQQWGERHQPRKQDPAQVQKPGSAF